MGARESVVVRNKAKDIKIAYLELRVATIKKDYELSEESRKQLEEDKGRLTNLLQNGINKVKELTERVNQLDSENGELLVQMEQVIESEQMGRERAQSQLASVTMELEIVRRELQQYNRREMQDLYQKRQAALECHRQEYLKEHPEDIYQMDNDINPEDGEDEIDG